MEISTTTNANDKVEVTQSSTIATYSYRKTNYSNNFSITGISGAPPSGSNKTIRVLTINLKTTGGDKYNIVITENLTTSSTVYAVSKNGETQTGFNNDASIEALTGEITDIDIFRGLPVAVTLTRTDGTAEFTTEYNISACTATNVDATIALNGTTISVAITSGYTFAANGSPIANGGTIS